MKPFTKKLVLENGREFYGYSYGADVERVCEIVFNTSVVGYQVEHGEFGAEMMVSLVNDGPVTICIDSKNRE